MKHEKLTTERPRAPMSKDVYLWVRDRLDNGEIQHDIAADLGWNQGRISEINTGKRGDPNQLSLL